MFNTPEPRLPTTTLLVEDIVLPPKVIVAPVIVSEVVLVGPTRIEPAKVVTVPTVMLDPAAGLASNCALAVDTGGPLGDQLPAVLQVVAEALIHVYCAPAILPNNIATASNNNIFKFILNI
jgi:hypothetical protein